MKAVGMVACPMEWTGARMLGSAFTRTRLTGNGWIRLCAAESGGWRFVFAGRLARRVCAQLEMAGGVEEVSRRADDADLYCVAARFAAGEDSAREFERCESRVVWRHDLFSFGSQRASEPVCL